MINFNLHRELKLSFLISIFSCSLVSCNNQQPLYHNLKSLVPYMHTIVFNDYVKDINHETVPPTNGGGCSTIRNGHLYGRNLDFYYSNMPSFIVKMKANKKKKRYASIGIAYHNGLSENDVIALEEEHNTHSHSLEILPNKTVDGINENGVTCCLNTCNFEDLSGGYHEQGIDGTNPGGEDLFAHFLCRYVLDHATSAKNAIELLSKCNIHIKRDESNYNLHYMIADKDETYVVELINDALVVKQKENDEQIMTNYYLNMTDEQIKESYDEDYHGDMTYPNNANGIERYNLLKIDYSKCNTIEGMRKALYKIRFSEMYPETEEAKTVPTFPSEDYRQDQIHHEPDPLYPDYEKIYKETRCVLNNKRRDLGKEFDVWYTIHSSIYDFNDKMLHLIVQEDYTYSYEVQFNNFVINRIQIDIE